MLLAPSGEHPQVQSVGVAGQAAVAGKEAGQRNPLALGEQRLDRHDDVGRGMVVVMATSGTQAGA